MKSHGVTETLQVLTWMTQVSENPFFYVFVLLSARLSFLVGYFSVSVLETALEVWGLRLLRWRSEEMRPFQAKPEDQLAFVLNLDSHWFTIRGFLGGYW
jgi:hypothetical protein